MPKASVTADSTGLDIQFATGESIRADLSALNPETLTRLTLHGLEQKVRDSYAGSGVTPEEAVGLVRKVWDNLVAGVWTSRAPGTPHEDILLRALEMVFTDLGKPIPETLAQTVAEYTQSERMKLRADPRVAAAIAKLKPKKESALDQLLG